MERSYSYHVLAWSPSSHLAMLHIPWTGVSLAHYLQRANLNIPPKFRDRQVPTCIRYVGRPWCLTGLTVFSELRNNSFFQYTIYLQELLLKLSRLPFGTKAILRLLT